MKNIIICSLLSGLMLIGTNYTLISYAKKSPTGKTKKINKNNKVYVSATRVYSAPAAFVNSLPLTNLSRGVFYFTNQSPAYTSAEKARLKGYKTNVYSKDTRWVLDVR